MYRTRFTDRIAYITGAASGLGAATAALFAAEGAKVFAVDVNGDGVTETVNAIRTAGGTAHGGVADVSDLESVTASVEYAIETFGGLHLLINVAGIGRATRFEEIDEAEWARIIGVNLTGVFNTTKAAIPHLLKQSGANIVNVASIAGLRGHAYCSHYAASKAGVVNFTRSLALEFATRGLRANCLAPGGILSPLIENFIPRDDFEPQIIAYYGPPVEFQLSTPEDMAKKIAFLASDDASMINGAVLVADGGTLA